MTSGLHQYTTGSSIILFKELIDLKVQVEVHSLTENPFSLPQLRLIETHCCQFLVPGRNLSTEETTAICYCCLVCTCDRDEH